MYKHSYNLHKNTNSTNSIYDDILYGIVTNKLKLVQTLVNSSNVNDIIDSTNNYTSLHYAVKTKQNSDIVEYLMKCGANPKIKQNEGKNAIDLAIEFNYKYLIERIINEKDNELDKLYIKYDDLYYKAKNLERTNKELENTNIELRNINIELRNTNENLIKSANQYIEKIDSLEVEKSNWKRKFDESDKEFANFLKKNKKF